MAKAFRKRVKCANCGMIYDVMVGDMTDPADATGECPSCKSNAFTEIKSEWKKY